MKLNCILVAAIFATCATSFAQINDTTASANLRVMRRKLALKDFDSITTAEVLVFRKAVTDRNAEIAVFRDRFMKEQDELRQCEQALFLLETR